LRLLAAGVLILWLAYGWQGMAAVVLILVAGGLLGRYARQFAAARRL
jgi:hypothetical protein